MKRIHSKIFLISSFGIPFIFILAILMSNNVVPFGDNSLIIGDMNNQYVALFAYFKQNIFHPMNFMYSSSLTLGGSFFGVFTYYLLNPLNYLIIFFSVQQLPLFFTILTTLKISLIGLTTYVFFSNSTFINKLLDGKLSELSKLIFSSAFALMNYTFVYKECVMWLDAIIMLPLIMIGIDKILYKNKIGLYVLTLTLTIFTNYYLGYIVGLYCCLIFIFLLVRSLVSKDLVKVNVQKLIQFILANIFSVLISAIVLIPSFLSTTGVSKNTSFNFQSVYGFTSLTRQLLRGDLGGNVPLVFAGIVVLFYFILFFFEQKFIDRIMAFILIILLFLSTKIDILYLTWHAFAWPNGYAQRESFVIVFTICVMGFIAFNKNVEKSPVIKQSSVVITGILILIIGLIAKFKTQLSVEYLFFILICVVGIIVCIEVLQFKKSAIIWLLIISLGSLFFVENKIVKLQVTNSSSVSQFSKYFTSTNNVIKKINSSDDEIFRIGNNFQINENDPMLFNYKGVSNYVSQQKNSLTDFMSFFGYYQKHEWHRWANYNGGSTLAMDRLFGIKYTISNKSKTFYDSIKRVNKFMYGDNFGNTATNFAKHVTELGEFTIAKDKLAYPLVFNTTRNAATLKSLKYDTTDNPFTNQNKIWKNISTFTNQNMYQKQKVDKEPNVDNQFNVVTRKDGIVYIYVPVKQSKEASPFYIYCNNRFIAKSFVDEGENGIVSLGNFKKGTNLKIKIKSDNKMLSNPYVSVENEKLFSRIRKQMVSKDIKNINYEGNKISFKTTSKYKTNNVMISVPFDTGWKAYEDDHRVGIVRGAGGLVMMKVKSGSHEIKLRYSVSGFFVGLILSLCGTLSLILYFVVKKYQKNKLK
ncbi:YfhO family protein [Paucilactobacillus nenjiangensis]|uniref:YfhO family protein n=1 Tax=Paucilactobacillus nenjiangensis TaxID=1296540 RepID=A0A5P1X164_9LACO|nr:YfhO family protein [Paucilactobacillus nenjiangensis]QER67125.1 YfhO family protein [Paucilactobacillus nenjiangensis]